VHKDRYTIGNCFHPETRKNQYGVDIGDARKLMLLGLRGKGTARSVLSAIRTREGFMVSLDWDNDREILAEIEAKESKA